MSEARQIESHAQPYAKQLLLLILALLPITGVLYFTRYFMRIPFLFTFGLIAFLAYAIYLVIQIYRAGSGKVSPLLFGVGAIFIMFGVTFDVIITVIKSPSLEMEANLVARLLLESGCSIEFVYVYGFTAQVMLIVLLCLMWATFLRHCHTIIELAWQLDPKTPNEFGTAIIYGKDITQRLWGHRLSYYRNYKWYHRIQLVFGISIVAPFLRIYAGLTWLNVRFSPIIPIAVIVLLWTTLYYIWVKTEYTKGPPPQLQ